MLKQLALIFFLIPLASFSTKEVLNIGIYHANLPQKLVFSIVKGEYELVADGKTIEAFNNEGFYTVENKNNKLQLRRMDKKIGDFAVIYLKRKKWASVFRIRSQNPKSSERQYYDNLYLTPKNNKIKVINNVYIEHYIAGVVESESGSKNNLEYYKVQAIITRTYALAHIDRHKNEGFNLCDRVHCQVYHSKPRYNPQTIMTAVNATKGIVIVDSDINLITAGFHSNCGGQTANSEDVWKYPVPYLRSVCDTFCTDMPHAKWEKQIPKSKWIDYFDKKHNAPIQDSMYLSCIVNHEPEIRERVLSYQDSTLLLHELRKDWKLRSTYFTIQEKNDTVYIQGHGFGHGVGLCQEGAMKMSENNYTFSEILHHYYTDVHLIQLSALDFFKD